MTAAPTLFLAVPLPSQVRSALAPRLSELAALGAGVHPVRSDGLHLTLRFLGRVDLARLDSVLAAAQEVTASGSPFALAFEGLGVFPSMRSARVVWASVGEGREQLERLADRLDGALLRQGWPAPARPFKAHCTLARVSERASPDARSRLARICQRPLEPAPLKMPAAALSLMESVPVADGPNRYLSRSEWRLGSG